MAQRGDNQKRRHRRYQHNINGDREGGCCQPGRASCKIVVEHATLTSSRNSDDNQKQRRRYQHNKKGDREGRERGEGGGVGCQPGTASSKIVVEHAHLTSSSNNDNKKNSNTSNSHSPRGKPLAMGDGSKGRGPQPTLYLYHTDK